MTQPTAPLSGTPVVPGVAYGPVLLARTDIPADRVAAFEETTPSAEEAMEIFDAAVEKVAGRLADRAAAAQGSAAEVLTATAGLARDKGLRTTVAGRVEGGVKLLAALHASVDQYADVY